MQNHTTTCIDSLKNSSAMYRVSFAIVIIATILLFSSCANQEKKDSLIAVKGALDLTQWDFKRDGNIILYGQWEFYPGIDWDSFDDHSLLPVPEYFSFPIEGTPPLDKINERARYYKGLFQLKVKLMREEQGLALYMGDTWGNYKIWVNRILVVPEENWGLHLGLVHPLYGKSQVDLPADSVQITITVQAIQSPLNAPVVKLAIGDEIKFKKMITIKKGMAFFLFGSLIIIAVYHFFLFLLHKDDISTFYFSMSCLMIAIHDSLIDGHGLWSIFSNLPFFTLYKIIFITSLLSALMIILFITRLFPHKGSKLIAYGLLLFGLGCALMTPAASLIWIYNVHFVCQFLFLILIVYFFVLLGWAAFHKKEGALIILIGGGLYALSAVVDILGGLRLIPSFLIPLTPIGMLLFVLFQGFAVARRFSKAFNTSESLARQLGEANVALTRLGKLKDEFIANTSHELRTPLNGIIGIGESIRDGAFGSLPQKVTANLNLITTSSRRLLALINDLLDFSRLKNSDLSLDLKPVDIYRLSNTVLAVTKPLANGKKLELMSHIPKNLPLVHGDEIRLGQIFYNLVGNAIKFTEQGEIKITARMNNKMIKISVTDTGIGIDEKYFDSIFKSFEQLEGSESRTAEGTGLGLAITKELVRLHGGEIGLSSGLGKGSTFYFTLPVSQELPEPNQALLASPLKELKIEEPSRPVIIDRKINNGKFSPWKTVLVVDDDPVNLQVVINHLSIMEEVNIYTRMSGQAALDFIEKELCPDLLILDIMMPQMTGYEVCQILRQTFSHQDLPVLILTAKNQVSDLVRGFDAGANDYLQKPFEKDELLSRVRTQLDLKQSYDTLRENLKLKKEIQRRQQTELDLKIMQQRLSRILDSLDDAILAVNEAQEISFCNLPCEKMLGYKTDELLGQPVRELFPTREQGHLREIFSVSLETAKGQLPPDPIKCSMIFNKDQSEQTCIIQSTLLEIDQEPLQVLILKKPGDISSACSKGVDQASALLFIQELNQNRRRIQILENALATGGTSDAKPEFYKNLGPIQEKLSEMETAIASMPGDLDKKHMGAKTMNLALEYWQEATGLGKVDLAEQSGIWKVYMNKDGFERTQTLDKYLKIERFPKQPRWNKIYQTIDYVLLTCKTPSKLKEELEITFSTLRMKN